MVSKLFTGVALIIIFGVSNASAQEIRGSAQFVPRHTIVTQFCESNHNCPKSEPYWALVLQTEKYNYEVDQRYFMGRELAPESISVAGAVVHQGEFISIDGTIEYLSEDYAYVGHIRSATPLIDGALSLPNWTCHGVMPGETNQSAEVIADIWYATPSASDRHGIYRAHLSVNHFEGSEYKKVDIANLSNVQARRERETLVYEGQSPNVGFTLNVEDSTAYRNVPGRLKISVLRDVIDEASTQTFNVEVKCTQNR